jgi:hypothetical protein
MPPAKPESRALGGEPAGARLCRAADSNHAAGKRRAQYCARAVCGLFVVGVARRNNLPWDAILGSEATSRSRRSTDSETYRMADQSASWQSKRLCRRLVPKESFA